MSLEIGDFVEERDNKYFKSIYRITRKHENPNYDAYYAIRVFYGANKNYTKAGKGCKEVIVWPNKKLTSSDLKQRLEKYIADYEAMISFIESAENENHL